ncbi:MAG TPA: hypothetical protein VGF98_01505 [Candidatus Tumulicola sp.]|jgi:hypothetical protein
MKSYITGLAVAIALAGCANAQSTATGGRLPYTPANYSHADSGDPVLYAVSTFGTGGAEMYDFKTGTRIGSLPGEYGNATTVCIGAKHDVWEAEGGYSKGSMVEYAPGAQKARAMIVTKYGPPYACSVNRNTGDLAVPIRARIAIFPRAPRFAPIYYTPVDHARYTSCVYDGSGNLFVVGHTRRRGGVFLVELPRGTTTFRTITLDRKLRKAGGIAWDGTNLAIGDGATSTIYRFSVSGSQAKTIGKTVLEGGLDVYYPFSIYNGTVTAALAQTTSAAGFAFWKYPEGGTPFKTFSQGYYESFAVAK